MVTRFIEEFWRNDNGFWIFSRGQTFLAMIFLALFLVFFSWLGLGDVPKIVFSIALGGCAGFFAGLRVKQIEVWRYGYWRLYFYFFRLVQPSRQVLLPSNYNEPAVDDEDLYSVVKVGASLPTDL